MSLQHWLLATRPRTLPAAVAPVVLASALAAYTGHFRGNVLAATLAISLLLQIGTNLANDYFDFVKGADTEERLGPIRVTQSGLIPPHTVRNVMLLVFALSAIPGLYAVSIGGWPLLLLGALSIASGIAYTGGPYPLGYNGLGDLFVYLFFGFASVGGTFFLHTGAIGPAAFVAGHIAGVFTTAIIVVNNLRDRHTDAKVGKNTLAVRWGEQATRRWYLALLVAGFVGILGLAALLRSPAPLGALLALPVARSTYRNFMDRDGAALNPSLGETARLLAVVCFLLALSLGAGALAGF